MRYPGGKNGAGVYQRIICQMPPHTNYVEAFLGSGAVLRHKRQAAVNVGIDVDAGVIARWAPMPEVTCLQVNALEWLASAPVVSEPSTLIYCDPPYVHAERSKRSIYRHEMTDADHERLLELLVGLRCMVVLSGYANALYARWLGKWRIVMFPTMTRGGERAECLWCNFPEPTELHDYRWLGEGHRERTRIKRKIARWRGKLRRMPRLERLALVAAVNAENGGEVLSAGNGARRRPPELAGTAERGGTGVERRRSTPETESVAAHVGNGAG